MEIKLIGLTKNKLYAIIEETKPSLREGYLGDARRYLVSVSEALEMFESDSEYN